MVIVLWLPIAVVLSLDRSSRTCIPTGLDVAVFAVAIWGAYLIRTMNLWVLGMISLWTTRVSAVFETYFVAELLFSGRLVPLQLMPSWVQTAADYLPFKWTFGYPIDTLVGDLHDAQLFGGLAMQAAVDADRRWGGHAGVARGDPPVHVGGELMAIRRLRALGSGKVAWLFLRVGAMNELQYRVNFFIQVFQSLLRCSPAWWCWRWCSATPQSLNGWSQPRAPGGPRRPDPDGRG